MSLIATLLVTAIIGLPIAWLIAEFRGSRSLRILLGILSLGVVSVCLWGLSGLLIRFNYNAYYGGATGALIGTSVHEIEDGHQDRVLKIWRALGQQYRPTYEWFDLRKGVVWKTETMHKLIRASSEQRKVTQRENPTSQGQSSRGQTDQPSQREPSH